MAERSFDFSERVSSVFGTLNATLKSFSESPCKQEPCDEPREPNSTRQSRDYTRTVSSTSRDRSPHHSHQRRPVTVSRGSRRRPVQIPDHVTNPQKWTKYDLRDDGTKNSDYEGLTSDQVNRKAAFKFLNRIRTESRDQEITPTSDDIKERSMKFKKPLRSKVIREEVVGGADCSVVSLGRQRDSGTHQVSSGTRVMPEYVVGAKQQHAPRPVRRLSGTTRERKTASSVALSHLDEKDEEEEDDDG